MNNIDAGDLRHRVTLQRLDSTPQYDSSGDLIQTWDSIGTYWAFVRPLQGRELVNAKQIVAEISHQVTMRDIGTITAQDRLVFQNRVLGIDAVYRVDEISMYYNIMVHELQGQNP